MKLDKMTTQYLATALWSTSGDDCENLDDKFSVSDISEEFQEKAFNECAQLYALISDLIYEDENDMEQIGHDFWLTRNRHGVGFWDGDYKNGQKITAIVQSYFKENGDDLRDSITEKAA